MDGTEVSAIRKDNGDVYIKIDDLIKSFYSDFTFLENDEAAVKKYIKSCVENWEVYQKKIRNKRI